MPSISLSPGGHMTCGVYDTAIELILNPASRSLEVIYALRARQPRSEVETRVQREASVNDDRCCRRHGSIYFVGDISSSQISSCPNPQAPTLRMPSAAGHAACCPQTSSTCSYRR